MTQFVCIFLVLEYLDVNMFNNVDDEKGQNKSISIGWRNEIGIHPTHNNVNEQRHPKWMEKNR